MIVENIDQGHGGIVLSFNGRLDFKSRHVYQNAVNQALVQLPKLLIFDFTHVSYIDSAGLGLLALTHKHQTDQGLRMVIAAPQKPVMNILNLANMGKVFPICASVAAAGQVPMPLR